MQKFYNTVIIIPARKGSQRFPNKPLARLLGQSVLERSWRIAQSVLPNHVFITTDDLEIATFAHHFGAKTLLTSGHFNNGTERVFAALKEFDQKPEIIINFQADAILTPPWVLKQLIDYVENNPHCCFATSALHLNQEQYSSFLRRKQQQPTTGTSVVFDQKGKALYFSKNILPYVRSYKDPLPVYRHIGLYAYRYETLAYYNQLPPSPLEIVEQLEQLRALEYGIPIQVLLADYRGRTHGSIDHPSDLDWVTSIIEHEGELLDETHLSSSR